MDASVWIFPDNLAVFFKKGTNTNRPVSYFMAAYRYNVDKAV